MQKYQTVKKHSSLLCLNIQGDEKSFATFKVSLLKWKSKSKLGLWNKVFKELISYQILLPGGSMGHRYVLELLFGKKLKTSLKTQQPPKAIKKSAVIWNPYNLRNFWYMIENFKNNQILFNKISHGYLATTKLISEWKILISAVE